MNRQALWTDTPFDATDLHLAYSRLTDDGRETIDKLVDRLNNGVSNLAYDRYGNTKVMFGKAQALELLAALGRLTLRLEDGAMFVDGVMFANPRAGE